MPVWLPSLFVSLGVGVILFLLNRITFKSSAQVTDAINRIDECILQLKKDSWTLEQRVALETRLVRSDERIIRLIEEVDFTKTSHQEFLRLLERALIPVAHSPHTPELDRLLEKRDRGEELTAEEWEDVIRRLDEQSEFYDNVPGKKVALKGLRAIYLTYLRQAQKKESLERLAKR